MTFDAFIEKIKIIIQIIMNKINKFAKNVQKFKLTFCNALLRIRTFNILIGFEWIVL